MRSITIGPWVGEFGWELMCWQAFARTIAKDYDHVFVMARPKHGYLYEDFFTVFESWEPGPGRCDMWIHSKWVKPDPDNYTGSGEMPFKVHLSYNPILKNDFRNWGKAILKPQMFNYHHPNMEATCQAWIYDPHADTEVLTGPIEPTFVQYGLTPPDSAEYDQDIDILFHARYRDLRSQDNWDRKKWHDLVDLCTAKGYKVAFIGSVDESLAFKPGQDLRDLEMQDLCWVMAHSRLCAGPSSGPMHLASLCKQEHLVWSFDRNRDRYETLWNPLNSPVRFIDEHSWHPPVEVVFEHIVDMLDG